MAHLDKDGSVIVVGASLAGWRSVETLRTDDAESIAGRMAAQFPSADIGVYRLLCEIRPKA